MLLADTVILIEKGRENVDLGERCRAAVRTLLSNTTNTILTSQTHAYEQQLEQVRSLDLLMAVCRLRG